VFFLCRLNHYVHQQYKSLTRRRNAMNKSWKIAIRGRGEGQYRRFVLMDRRGRYWTGTRWTRDPRKALLYATCFGAYREYQRIMEERHRNTPMREFEAVIRVRVFADEPFSLEALGDFLGAVTQINGFPGRAGVGLFFAEGDVNRPGPLLVLGRCTWTAGITSWNMERSARAMRHVAFLDY
jgi:hypothetical protein